MQSHRYRVHESQVAACVAAAYDLSKPQGLGVHHFRAGPLPADQIKSICGVFPPERGAHIRVSMDYVNGRACKFDIRRDVATGDLWIEAPNWYDHTPEQLVELALRCQLGSPVPVEAAA